MNNKYVYIDQYKTVYSYRNLRLPHEYKIPSGKFFSHTGTTLVPH